ncbi:MAG TPA: hypothetical protein VN256_16430 [Pyrinomonadaceae bacterium]|nr:hypothetical protein [Pyrinomonadaceae bacterium]
MVLGILVSMVDGRNAVYMSAPITSGARFLRWRGQHEGDVDPWGHEFKSDFQREVVEPNRARARSVARGLRESFREVLIDPTAVDDIDGWTQDDYRHLWARIIEEYVRAVICTDGWQYSNGSSYEFLVAQRCAIATLKENRETLTLEEGMQLIQSAIDEMRAPGLSTVFLENVLDELGKLRAEKGVCAK